MKKFSSLFGIIMTCALIISPVESSLSVYGVEFIGNAAPGRHLSHNLTLALSSDELNPVNLTADILDWLQNSNGSNIGVKENADIAPYSAKKYLSVSPKNFSISPGAAQDVKIEGDVPIGDGGRYAIVMVHTLPNSAKGDRRLGVSIGVNTIVILTISGSKIIKEGKIENLSLVQPISAEQPMVSFMFKNIGNYHYRVNVSAYLKGERDQILAEAFPEIRGSVIPTAARHIKFSLVPGSKLESGTYTIKVNAALSDGTYLDSKEIKFQISA